MNLKEINPLVLAYLGDSVYETYIRKIYLILVVYKKNLFPMWLLKVKLLY